MKMSQTLIFVAIALVLAFTVLVKAQDWPHDYLREHNRARGEVGVAPLKWDHQVAQYAWNYAQQRKRDCGLVPSNSGGRYGENLAWNSGDVSGAWVVKSWVNEKNDYSYDSNTCHSGKKCGHYTQAAWRSTVWVGCAKVRCDNGGTFVTCNYYPRGNIPGRKPY